MRYETYILWGRWLGVEEEERKAVVVVLLKSVRCRRRFV